MENSGELSQLNGRWTRRWGAASGGDVVVAIHGLLTHSAWFGRLGDAISNSGLTLVCADRRDAGLNKGINDPGYGDMASPDDMVNDELQLAKSLRETFTRVHLLAWCGTISHGAVLAQRHPEIYQSLVFVAPLLNETMTPYMVKATQGYAAIASSVEPTALVDSPGYGAGLVDEAMEEEVTSDKLLLRRNTPRFTKNFVKYIPEVLGIVPTLTLPLAMVFAKRDRLTDPDKAVAHLKPCLPPKTTIELVDGPHACWLADDGVTARVISKHVTAAR